MRHLFWRVNIQLNNARSQKMKTGTRWAKGSLQRKGLMNFLQRLWRLTFNNLPGLKDVSSWHVKKRNDFRSVILHLTVLLCAFDVLCFILLCGFISFYSVSSIRIRRSVMFYRFRAFLVYNQVSVLDLPLLCLHLCKFWFTY